MEGRQRNLIVTADDFGIGQATSEGILEAAEAGAVTASVLLVNAPEAESAVRAWRQRGCPMELGWHPNLTLDRPIAAPSKVPSLLAPDGCFWPLNAFMRRWLFGQLREEEIEIELKAQLGRFFELVGQAPVIVNSHQHVAVFAPVGNVLLYVLDRFGCNPFVRRVRETWSMVARVPGARVKRMLLTLLGRRFARTQSGWQFVGNDWLAGITDPEWVKDPMFFQRWLHAVPGANVELMCHPGRLDLTLLGRDCQPCDGLLERRVNELQLLRQPAFREAVQAAGFTLTRPTALINARSSNVHVA
jgi:predicted glycoside hydrolase/deacetylase ChbG (UPF0249 family)